MDLDDPRKLVFHRVFYREDAPLQSIELIEGGIESRCLSASCGAGYQDHTVWLGEHGLEGGQSAGRESDQL